MDSAMTFICPKCHQEFNVKDFDQDQQNLAHVKEWLAAHEQTYKKELEVSIKEQMMGEIEAKHNLVIAQLKLDLEKAHDLELNNCQKDIIELSTKLKQQNELNESKQQELRLNLEREASEQIAKMNQDLLAKQTDINNLRIQLERQIEKAAEELNAERLTMKNSYQEELNQHVQTITRLNESLNSAKSEQEHLLKNARLEIEKTMQAAVNAKDEKIAKLMSDIEILKQTDALTLAKREQDWNDLMHKKETEFNDKIRGLEVSLSEKRNIKTGIMGSNLENGFQETMSSAFTEDKFEKTTKAINGRKPDFMLTINDPQNQEKKFGRILFEIKAGENLDYNGWEDKLNKELIEWNADYGLIIASHAHAPFERSAKFSNIYYVNTEINVFIFIVNVLKMGLIKQGNLLAQVGDVSEQQDRWAKLREWKQNAMNIEIGKGIKELDKIRDNAGKIIKLAEGIAKAETLIRDDILLKINSALDELLK